MSKARDIIENVKRFQFWILCGLISVVSIVCWWLATSSLATTYTANKSKIEAEAGKIDTVRGINPHPNPKWNESYDAQVVKDKKTVESAWRKLYNEQKQKVYVWPPELGQDFVDHVTNLRPGGEIRLDLRDRYQFDVLKQFQALAKLVDAEWENPKEQSSTTSRGYGVGVELAPGAVQRRVIWNGQMQLQAPFVWTERPTTLQILYAQEEIWVIKAICQAIVMGNAGSTGPHDAAVTTIEELSIGFDAAEEFPRGEKEPGRITPVKGGAAGGPSSQVGYGASMDAAATGGYGLPSTSGEGEASTGGALPRPERPDRQGVATSREGGFSSSMGYGTPSREGGAGGTTTGLLVPDPAAAPEASASTNPDDYLNDWRYVDVNSKPITKEEFGTPQFHEYRLMPWRLRVTVDQRRWDELLVMFRNTDLPLEIRQVRVNPILDGSGSSGIGYGGGRGGDTRRMPFPSSGAARLPPMMKGSRVGYGSGRESSMTTMGTEEPTDTLILELRGVAYLINPPDLTKIGAATAGAADATATTGADATAVAQ
jgi:hypothetical protein